MKGVYITAWIQWLVRLSGSASSHKPTLLRNASSMSFNDRKPSRLLVLTSFVHLLTSKWLHFQCISLVSGAVTRLLFCLFNGHTCNFQ